MSREVKVKTFILALNTFHSSIKECKKFFNDKRLTQAEKKILECWFLLRDSNFQEIQKILPQIQTNYDPLVTSQKNLIWGITLNNKSEYHKAIPLILESIQVIAQYPLKSVEFTATYNLFIAYLNYKDKNGMKACLDKLKSVPCVNPRQTICYLSAIFKYYSFCENYEKAEDILEELESLKSNMSEPLIISHLISKFSFYSRLEKYDICEEVLLEMKKYRKFHFSANFSYMRLMLDHIVSKKPLYVYEQNFAEHPFLFFQLKVVQLLEENNVGEAKSYWNKLRNLAPHTYLENFVYCGDKNIFSLNLNNYAHLFDKVNQEKIKIELPHNKEEALIKVLSNAQGPIRKDELYETIWQQEAKDKNDYSKLKMLIARIRQKYNLEINYRKGCYILANPLKKSA